MLVHRRVTPAYPFPRLDGERITPKYSGSTRTSFNSRDYLIPITAMRFKLGQQVHEASDMH